MIRTNLHYTKENYRIYHKMDQFEFDKYFASSEDCFLPAIDTFYYSVYVAEDFLETSENKNVLAMYEFFTRRKLQMSYDSSMPFPSRNPYLQKLLIMSRSMPLYEFHVSNPDLFDIFIARHVPNVDTPQIHVQLRSEMLWEMGARAAFDESMKYVTALLCFFKFKLEKVIENRCDYCWHTNYFDNPYRFLNIDNVAKSVVSHLTVVNQHAKLKGAEDYEIDYLGLGNIRSHKVFFRMYLKCKEVIEVQKKGFFFEIWYRKGLISAYDKEVFETCYCRENSRWEYIYKAMLKFYLDHVPEAEDDEELYIQNKCQAILDDAMKVNYDDLKKFALQLVPMPTLVFNVEFATWRRFTGSFKVIQLPKNLKEGCAARVYDFLDATKAICTYLTADVVRFTKGTDPNKSRRDMHPFWRKLRDSIEKDVKLPEDWQDIIREYQRNISLEKQKNKMQCAISTYSVYQKGKNEDSIIQDWADALSSLNDNDFVKMAKYKEKKMQQLGEAAASRVVRPLRSLSIVDYETSEILSSATYHNAEDWISQDGIDEADDISGMNGDDDFE